MTTATASVSKMLPWVLTAIRQFAFERNGKWVVHFPVRTKIEISVPLENQLAVVMQFASWLESNGLNYKNVRFIKKSPQKPAHVIMSGIGED
jgi:hypothetical protein